MMSKHLCTYDYISYAKNMAGMVTSLRNSKIDVIWLELDFIFNPHLGYIL
jgi:hypothetical protein